MMAKSIALHVGDQVIHPRFGFGIVQALLTYDNEGVSTEYYEVRLADRGMLSVPVARAAALGLRRLINGVAATLALIGEGAGPLPEHPRHRGIELAARWAAPESAALAGGVRDLLGHARRFGLKGADEKWLSRACERLGTEAARVDDVTPDLARAAISVGVTALKPPPPPVAPPRVRAPRALPVPLPPRRRPAA